MGDEAVAGATDAVAASMAAAAAAAPPAEPVAPEPPETPAAPAPAETPVAGAAKPAAEVAEESTTGGAAPWDKAVSERFTDPEQAKAVSEFMRESYQPYVTTIEQERAELRDRAMLFDQFEEDADSTMREVAAELYGDEVADKVAEILAAQGVDPDEPGAAPAQAAAKTQDAVSSLSKEDQEALAWAKEQRTATTQQAQMDEYLADAAPHIAANPDIPAATFHRYVATTGGDFEVAVAAYRAEHPAAPAAPGAPAPATLGSAPASGPTTRKIGSLADAASSVFEAARKGG